MCLCFPDVLFSEEALLKVFCCCDIFWGLCHLVLFPLRICIFSLFVQLLILFALLGPYPPSVSFHFFSGWVSVFLKVRKYWENSFEILLESKISTFGVISGSLTDFLPSWCLPTSWSLWKTLSDFPQFSYFFVQIISYCQDLNLLILCGE